TGSLDAIAEAAAAIDRPLLVRAPRGIPRWAAREVVEREVAGIVTGGAEVAHPGDASAAGSLGQVFANWGIPTIAAVRMLRGIGVPVVSEGRIESGLDAARAIALGADLVVVPAPGGEAGVEALAATLDRLAVELRMAMFLVGAARLAALKQAPFVATGESREWLEAAETLWRADAAST
ncbi:MAG: alpha-hydroxy-acid oxidizing protein, partial [Thermomicrobiaceae bacterium]|nr:alpha-hydroxy-acid oxidizing protein [Thermomicrobiaceae bacterium]